MDFTQAFLQGAQQGQQRAAALKRQERDDEEFDLKKQMLQIELKKIDTMQKIVARQAAEQGGENWSKRDAPAQPQPTGGATPTGGAMPALNMEMANPTSVEVDLPEAPGMPATRAMYPTRTGTMQTEDAKFNQQQGAIEARSKVFVEGRGFIDKEIFMAEQQEKRDAARTADLNARLDRTDANVDKKIASAEKLAREREAGQERRLFLQGKAIAATEPGVGEDSSFITQPGFRTLPPPERTKAVRINGIIAMATSYRDLVEDLVGPSGIELFGKDAAVLEALHAKLLLEAAAGFEQGALQAPDKAIVEKTFYDPTSLTSVFSTSIKGQRQGRLNAMDKVLEDLSLKLKVNYGLTPTTGSKRASTAKPGSKASGGLIVVVAPDGSKHTFPDQVAADRFKQLAGIK